MILQAILEDIIVILCALYISLFCIMLFWKAQRRLLLLLLVVISFVLTPLDIANHSWVRASIDALGAILLFIYLAAEEVIKRLKP